MLFRGNKKNTAGKKGNKQKMQNADLVENVADLKSLFIPDGLYEHSDYIYLGPARYARTFALTVYPRETYVGWLDDIFSVGEIDVSVTVEDVPNDLVISELTEKVAQVESIYRLYRKTGNILQLPALEAMLADLEAERKAIQTNRDKMFYVTVLITLHAKSLEELEHKTMILEDIMARKATQMRTLCFRQIEAFKTTLPTGLPPIRGFSRNVTTGGLATLFPIANPDLTHPSGIYLGRNLFTGAPVFIDSFAVPKYLNNQHIVIFGIPGSGKSVALKLKLARNAAAGTRIVVLDPEGEYKKLINDLLGGEYITIQQGKPAGINLFEIEPDVDETGQKEYVPILEKVAEIRNLLGAIARNFMGRPLTALEIVAVEQAVTEVYRDRGITQDPKSLYEEGGKRIDSDRFVIGRTKKAMPTLSDFREKLMNKPNGAEIAQILVPFTKTGSMGMFDCESKIDSNTPIIGFNLSEIKDEFTKFYATYVILTFIWQKFVQKNRGVNKMIACDETWMFVKYPESAKFLNDLARRGRKHKAALIVASQFIDEFLSNEEGKAVVNSCATAILMRQNPSATDMVVKHFNLASGAGELLQTFSPGECILSLNGVVTAIKVEPTPYEWAFITT